LETFGKRRPVQDLSWLVFIPRLTSRGKLHWLGGGEECLRESDLVYEGRIRIGPDASRLANWGKKKNEQPFSGHNADAVGSREREEGFRFGGGRGSWGGELRIFRTKREISKTTRDRRGRSDRVLGPERGAALGHVPNELF